MTTALGTIWETFERSAHRIIDDKNDGIEQNVSYRSWMQEGTIKGPFFDDIEMAGPAFAFDVPEAHAIPVGDLTTGTVIRYNVRKVGIQMTATEEVIEDNREPDALRMPRRMKGALWRTVDLDGTGLMIYAEDANFPRAPLIRCRPAGPSATSPR
jgi:hypothetical protein